MSATIYLDVPGGLNPAGYNFGPIGTPTPEVLENIFAHNLGATLVYFQIYDLANQPTSGVTVPLYNFPLQPFATVNFTPPGQAAGAVIGREFSQQISIAFSTTPKVFTNTGNMDNQVWATYRLVDA